MTEQMVGWAKRQCKCTHSMVPIDVEIFPKIQRRSDIFLFLRVGPFWLNVPLSNFHRNEHGPRLQCYIQFSLYIHDLARPALFGLYFPCPAGFSVTFPWLHFLPTFAHHFPQQDLTLTFSPSLSPPSIPPAPIVQTFFPSQSEKPSRQAENEICFPTHSTLYHLSLP